MVVESGALTANFKLKAIDGQAEPVMLSVVIPALNEENGIADLLRRVEAVKPSLRSAGVENLEITVVDDGSRDRTAEIAAGFPSVRLIRHPRTAASRLAPRH